MPKPAGNRWTRAAVDVGMKRGMMVQALVGVLLAAAILLAVVAATRAPALRVGGAAGLTGTRIRSARPTW